MQKYEKLSNNLDLGPDQATHFVGPDLGPEMFVKVNFIYQQMTVAVFRFHIQKILCFICFCLTMEGECNVQQ